MRILISGLGLVFLLGISISSYAVDCTTSFDQHCLSSEYDAKQIESDQQKSVEELDQRLQKEENASQDNFDEEAWKAEQRAIAMDIINSSPKFSLDKVPSGLTTIYEIIDFVERANDEEKLQAAWEAGPETYRIVSEYIMQKKLSP